jgi:hypothetical protein
VPTAEPESTAPQPEIRPRPELPFRPSLHGFAFTNSFEGDPLPDLLRQTALARIARRQGKAAGLAVPDRFGLCGGMSAAAADFYRAARAVPDVTKPPREGDPLYAYLKQRNLDSLGAGVMAMKFIEWMNLPESSEGDCTSVRTATELASIEVLLGRHGLTPIGLVYVDVASGKPWENHQVLAYRMEQRAGSAVLYMYDPNFPHDDHARLEIQLTQDGLGRQVANVVQRTTRWESWGRPVRGVFAMPYAPRVPPDELR